VRQKEQETFMHKSRYSFVSLLFVLALLAAGAVLFTTPTMAAPADSPCNLTVNDAAKVLTTTQLANVTSAAKSLEASAPNSTVRVVIVSKNPTSLAELAYQQCGIFWYSNPSTLKPNMILLMVKPSTPGVQDGKSLVAAGSMYPELTSQTQNILATMNPSFQSGDYAGGLIAGLRYMQQLAQVNSQPSANPDNSPGVTPQKPADLTPVWIISGTLVVLVGLAILASFIIYLRRTKKGENAAKRVAQQDAKLIRTQAVNAVRELTDKINDPTLQARIALASQANTVNAQILEQTYQALSTNVSNLSIDLRNITSSASNPDNDKTVQEYQRICSYFAPIVREADALQNMLTRLEHQLDEVERDPGVQLGTSARQQRELGHPRPRQQ
jgi:uncharacterized membrane protein YgcG